MHSHQSAGAPQSLSLVSTPPLRSKAFFHLEPSRRIRIGRSLTLLIAVVLLIYSHSAHLSETDEPFRRLITSLLCDLFFSPHPHAHPRSHPPPPPCSTWSAAVQAHLRIPSPSGLHTNVDAALPLLRLGLVASASPMGFWRLVLPMLACLLLPHGEVRRGVKAVVCASALAIVGGLLLPAVYVIRLREPGSGGVFQRVAEWSLAGDVALRSSNLADSVSVDETGVFIDYAESSARAVGDNRDEHNREHRFGRAPAIGARGSGVVIPREFVVKEVYYALLERLWETDDKGNGSGNRGGVAGVEPDLSRSCLHDLCNITSTGPQGFGSGSDERVGLRPEWENLLTGSLAANTPDEVVFVTFLSLIAGEVLGPATPWRTVGTEPAVCAFQTSLDCSGFHTGDCVGPGGDRSEDLKDREGLLGPADAVTVECPQSIRSPMTVDMKSARQRCYPCVATRNKGKRGCLPAMLDKIRGTRESEYTTFLKSDRLLAELFIVLFFVFVAPVVTCMI